VSHSFRTRYSVFRPFGMSHYNMIVSTFSDCFRRIGLITVSGGYPSLLLPLSYRADHSRFIQTLSPINWRLSFSCCGFRSFNVFCVRRTFSSCIEINHHIFRLQFLLLVLHNVLETNRRPTFTVDSDISSHYDMYVSVSSVQTNDRCREYCIVSHFTTSVAQSRW